MANVVVQLLQMPADDQSLMHLASACILVEQERACGVPWSNDEMDTQRAAFLNLQALNGEALHFALGEMLEATQKKLPLPDRDELVLRAARLLFCQEFQFVQQVEMALTMEGISLGMPANSFGIAPRQSSLGLCGAIQPGMTIF
eukprot:CAMPEP_0169072428 /NCGR_PEP_ID=MMETSP1015-20121227/6192_1 /TAXON_ID=342587 /ORGANISM="Karlodinium micrum, Strain CCMP2283" /LENGTH=143 /DNA_ID=CAMNT_0009131589 /DNA_START=39 /DNA_END=470 /DNA_ORIENTATION=+